MVKAKREKMIKRLLGLAVATMLAMVGALVEASPAAARPYFRVPFHCGQVWSGQTRTNHSPAYAIDFNRADDLGDHVLASQAGTVDIVRDLGNTSYGKYIRINHGDGWTTYYAHLRGFNVSVGQKVYNNTVIGYVGSTGNSSGPHLHFEQRYNGNDVKIRMEGSVALYWGTKNYKRICG